MNMNPDHNAAHPLRAAAVTAALSLLLLGILYPATIVLVGQAAFPAQANGSLIGREGRVLGSALVGQSFDGDAYLIGRPSAADYDPTSVGGSNLAPSDPALRGAIADRTQTIRLREHESTNRLPADAVTASGAGIDPHISPAYAELQIARIAARRGVPPEQVRSVIERHTQGPMLGVLGQPRVHVLNANLALDDRFPVP